MSPTGEQTEASPDTTVVDNSGNNSGDKVTPEPLTYNLDTNYLSGRTASADLSAYLARVAEQNGLTVRSSTRDDLRTGSEMPPLNTSDIYATNRRAMAPEVMTGPLGARLESPIPGRDTNMGRILRGDRTGIDTSTPEARQRVELAHIKALTDAGIDPARAATLTREILAQISKNTQLVGGPHEQLARMTRGMEALLRPDLSESPNAMNILSDRDRRNMVVDIAQRLADPEKYGNQGTHHTCSTQAIQKLVLQGKDPASAVEMLAGAANNQVAMLRGQPVRIDNRSLTPDHESSQDPSTFGGRDVRGMAGHVLDAIYGQAIADHASTPGNRLVYMASGAHLVENGAFQGRTRTGEGMFRVDETGRFTRLITDSPMTSVANEAYLTHALGLPPGSLFIHRSMADHIGSLPQHLQDQITMFDNTQGLRTTLRRLETEHGRAIGHLRVNAPFLPEGGMSGHGFHAVNIGLNGDRLTLDNNWGINRDHTSINDDQLMLAVDLGRQGPGAQRVMRDGPNGPVYGRPDVFTPTGPGTGRAPNEEPDVYQRRIEQLREQRQQETQSRLKELAEKPRLTTPERQERDQLLQQSRLMDRVHNEFNRAYREWLRTDPKTRGNEPSFDWYLMRHGPR